MIKKRMVIGVTGSRHGMTALQRFAALSWLGYLVDELGEPIDELHHGDCVGVDEEMHNLVLEHKFVSRIVIHPPTTHTYRANVHVLPSSGVKWEITAPAPYLDRDKAIVQASYVLLAFPEHDNERVRSGTWYTVRYARHRKRSIRLFMPDGRIVSEDFD